jgi:hypothetical protein
VKVPFTAAAAITAIAGKRASTYRRLMNLSPFLLIVMTMIKPLKCQQFVRQSI